MYPLPGTDHNGKPETETKQNGHTEGENGTLSEDRKRKHDDTPVNGEHNSEDVKRGESVSTTDVNGNEGPDAKKKKLEYIENGHKNEMVNKITPESILQLSGCIQQFTLVLLLVSNLVG